MKKKTFRLIEYCLLTDKKPSTCLAQLMSNGLFDQEPFILLKREVTTEQSPIHHPEGNVWNHTLLVVDQAATLRHLSQDPRALMWAALLHDVGKTTTTKKRNGKISSYDHDKAGEKLAVAFLEGLTDDREFITKVSKMVRYHMHLLFFEKKLSFGNFKELLQETNLEELTLLGYADRMGRPIANSQQEQEAATRFYEALREKKEKP